MRTLTLIAFVVLAAFTSAPAQANQGKEEGSKKSKSISSPNCLEVTARPLLNGEPMEGVSITLYCGNEEVLRIDSTDHSKTEFTLKRDQYYTIEIKKNGYAPRLVGIYTHVPAVVPLKPLFRYEYEVEMVPAAPDAEDFYLDFPVALVSYNKKNEVFEPIKKYSKLLKKEIAKVKSEQAAAAKE